VAVGVEMPTAQDLAVVLVGVVAVVALVE